MSKEEWQRRIADTVGRMGCIEYFPSEPDARAAIMDLIYRMVSDANQLRWLETTMIDRIGSWSGPMELRGVFCSRFKPKDGIEANCASTPGFTASDLEQRYLDKGPVTNDSKMLKLIEDLSEQKRLR